ncbi:site-specific DNA-methyltransferase [Luedemannella flava]|uniref:Methyltransferase n=1 Tax=Luedemannella flava TaxID=349316 RepID=A0ABP4XUH0_9ACTN
MTLLPRNTILQGDALEQLAELPPGSIDCVITSPPYYALRDYGRDGQLGLEPTIDGWVANLRRVFAELARVIKPTGAAWLNLGDSYSRHDRYGVPAKGLLLGPERVLLALAADGWLVRNKVVWIKPNPQPSSVTDRLTCAYEVVYLLVRSRSRYFFDLDAVREPHRSTRSKRARPGSARPPGWAGPLAGSQEGLRRPRSVDMPGHILGKNPTDAWVIAPSAFRGGHFATFPEALVRRPLLATCPEAVCTACGEPWRRRTTRTRDYSDGERPGLGPLVPCGCGAPTAPGVVLDPFAGSGTVAIVARRHGRDYLGIELNPDYVRLAEDRIGRADSQGP